MSIRVKTLEKAVAEAKRFLEAAEVVKRVAGRTEYVKGDLGIAAGSIAQRQNAQAWTYRGRWQMCGAGFNRKMRTDNERACWIRTA